MRRRCCRRIFARKLDPARDDRLSAARHRQAQDRPQPRAGQGFAPPEMAVARWRHLRRRRGRSLVRSAAASGDGPGDHGRDVVSIAAARGPERHRLCRRAAQGGHRLEGDRAPRVARRRRRFEGQVRRSDRPPRQPRRHRAGAERGGRRPRGARRARAGAGRGAGCKCAVEAQPGPGRQGIPGAGIARYRADARGSRRRRHRQRERRRSRWPRRTRAMRRSRSTTR